MDMTGTWMNARAWSTWIGVWSLLELHDTLRTIAFACATDVQAYVRETTTDHAPDLEPNIR
jgi:hypothetical protein